MDLLNLQNQILKYYNISLKTTKLKQLLAKDSDKLL